MTPSVSRAAKTAADQSEPLFAEPWQAQAFALAVRLSEQGHFTWKECEATLAAELKAAVDRGEPDDGSRCYEHWLAALERLVAAKRLSRSGGDVRAPKSLGGGLPPHASWHARRASFK